MFGTGHPRPPQEPPPQSPLSSLGHHHCSRGGEQALSDDSGRLATRQAPSLSPSSLMHSLRCRLSRTIKADVHTKAPCRGSVRATLRTHMHTHTRHTAHTIHTRTHIHTHAHAHTHGTHALHAHTCVHTCYAHMAHTRTQCTWHMHTHAHTRAHTCAHIHTHTCTHDTRAHNAHTHTRTTPSGPDASV